MKTTLLAKFDILKSGIEAKWNSIKINATTAWNNIKEAITKPISSAYDSLKQVFDKIGKLFEKQFKLDIKLPTIETEEGEDGKPKFKVKWNASAMQTGRILKNATIFGMDNRGLLGGGEAGPEAIVGQKPAGLPDPPTCMLRNSVAHLQMIMINPPHFRRNRHQNHHQIRHRNLRQNHQDNQV